MIENIEFTWDTDKAQTNFIKHKVTFDEAKTVFEDENARLLLGPDHSQEEERFVLLGLSIKSKILTVVHRHRDDEKIYVSYLQENLQK